MAESKPKREIPGPLKSLLDLDARISKEIVEAVNKKYPIVDFRHHLKHLEISCHGVPWFMITIAGMYMVDNPELWVNLLIGLLLDIVIVAVLKAFTRRRRPAYNIDDLFLVSSIDKFSFPSGHATRAVLLGVFFNILYPLHFIFFIPIMVWSSAVCASRVILGRHHVLDVVCGVLIGILEGLILSKVWLSREGAGSIISAFGGEDPWSSS
ncbi:phospholipid phosphatase 6 [Eurytemora carolleeae]|uniref:phospholipid phosphatase 6 n=1 Tax=Eurytemora carolleeae TaxID=1294199 RepID=UPI000C756416|nr:phospholipid phosphatase 6 [Eurytemora carolleeae]|eukprot:XP_023325512.1 phospholipid phosphatase 6-like [Eurytemora affinis]